MRSDSAKIAGTIMGSPSSCTDRRMLTRSDRQNQSGGNMTNAKISALLTAAGLWVTLSAAGVFAQDKSAEAPVPGTAPATAPVASASAPKLPAYFTGTSDDRKKPPAWPDQTG